MTTQVDPSHGHNFIDTKPKTEAEKEKIAKTEQMRNSAEYKAKLKKITVWLQQLDAADSNPNNGRVDISVFNAKVSQYGYEPKYEYEGSNNHGLRLNIKPDVDINAQAEAMADKYYAKKFGL